MYKPSDSAVSASRRPAVKQWMTPPNRPARASSARIAAMSSSALRLWMTSGRPDCRAAAT